MSGKLLVTVWGPDKTIAWQVSVPGFEVEAGLVYEYPLPDGGKVRITT